MVLHWRALLPPTLIALIAGSCIEANPYTNICGNGLIEQEIAEECDDGVENGNRRACTNACLVAFCGDGYVHEGVEECDLGESNNHPEGPCTPDCRLVACGDGIQDPGEECDEGDGNKLDADGQGGCSTLCRVLPRCGDGVLQEPWEACDDGNSDDFDECLNTCEIATCGDGVLQEDIEECDDGNNLDSDACLTSCEVASCGDGHIYAGVEECEPPDEGCNSACLLDRTVFVTSESTTAGELGGIDGADLRCQEAASAAGLDRPERFKAWLSEFSDDPNNGVEAPRSPADRFTVRDARYVLVDGNEVAGDWAELTSGQLAHPINRSAQGEFVVGVVWTATDSQGKSAPQGPAQSFCSNWSNPDLNEKVDTGVTTLSDQRWTYDVDYPLLCYELALLYCFED